MTYAIIKVAGKQYRVREGERLLVDRLHEDEGATFTPTVLLVGGNGAPQLEPGDGLAAVGLAAERWGLLAPIDSIWICVSDARKPVWRR